MTIAIRLGIGTVHDWIRRAKRLKRGRGNACLVYAVLRRVAMLPPFRRWAYVCSGDLFRLTLAESVQRIAAPRGFTTRLANSSDMSDLATYYGNEKRVLDRFARGDLCLVTELKSEIGAAVWISVGPSEFLEDGEELHALFRFPANVAWSYDGKGTKFGAWGTLMQQLPAFLKQRGVNELLTHIGTDNWRSLDAHRSLGYEAFGRLTCFGLFGLSGTLCRAIQKRWRCLPVRFDLLEVQKRINF